MVMTTKMHLQTAMAASASALSASLTTVTTALIPIAQILRAWPISAAQVLTTMQRTAVLGVVASANSAVLATAVFALILIAMMRSARAANSSASGQSRPKSARAWKCA